ncbi:hypothetical protein [Croceibacterium aestuarii]|uniref:hypothetical protein n=1 Tax=Croceibacterium aestuarii TaxID=3064139 RepID=UPI00272E6DEF|nr:hypothetical protein [Croceibacterium sp. D39]
MATRGAGRALFAGAGPAHAEWLESQSAHFVVYADDDEEDIRQFSTRLELYHSALELVTGTHKPAPSPSNRVTVYVVKNEREVRRLAGEKANNIAGFYIPRAGGSVAFVPAVRMNNGDEDFSMIVLLHEYAHHFLISNSSFPTPRWLNEGGAEFFASSEFPKDGGVRLGMPAMHRVDEIFYARDVRAHDLLDPEHYADGKNSGYDAFYGKSWLLYHFLTMNPERGGQLRQYVSLLANGVDSVSAGEQAFGDLKQLEKDLDKYTRQRLYTAIVPPDKLPIGKVAVRKVSPGEAEILPVRMRSKRGVDSETAPGLLAEAREIAARYPENPAVLSELAEAEFDAGNDDGAIAAADRALAVDPSAKNALVQKGYALFRKAEAADAEAADAAFAAAMQPFVKLNHLENDNPLPLIYNFRSFAERGVKPDENAVHGLERATQLAPFDLGLRLELAGYELATGDLKRARYNLIPVAYNPHGGTRAEAARAVIDRIDGGETEISTLQTLLYSASSADDGEGEGDGA